MKFKYLKLCSITEETCVILKYNYDLAIVTTESNFCTPGFIPFFSNNEKCNYKTLDLECVGKVERDKTLETTKGRINESIYIGRYLDKAYLYLADYHLLINLYHSADELAIIISKFEVEVILLFTDEIFISPTDILLSTILN